METKMEIASSDCKVLSYEFQSLHAPFFMLQLVKFTDTLNIL